MRAPAENVTESVRSDARSTLDLDTVSQARPLIEDDAGMYPAVAADHDVAADDYVWLEPAPRPHRRTVLDHHVGPDRHPVRERYAATQTRRGVHSRLARRRRIEPRQQREKGLVRLLDDDSRPDCTRSLREIGSDEHDGGAALLEERRVPR